MDLTKLGVKIPASQGQDLPLRDLIPHFHKLIQDQALPGLLLIDVAEYTHMHQGPGILLIAHEANVSLDEEGGRRGLLVTLKRPPHSDAAAAFSFAMETAQQAAALLEKATGGKLRFDLGRLEIFLNDRLAAPNDEAHRGEFRKILEPLLAAKYPGKSYAWNPEVDPRRRCGFTLG